MLEPPYSLKSVKYNSILLVKSLKLANQQETVLIITKQNYKFVLNFKKLIIQFKLINFIELKSLKKLLFLFHKLKKRFLNLISNFKSKSNFESNKI